MPTNPNPAILALKEANPIHPHAHKSKHKLRSQARGSARAFMLDSRKARQIARGTVLAK